jgi:hypothetical protein
MSDVDIESLEVVYGTRCVTACRKNGVVGADAPTSLPRKLSDRSYKPICAFGYLGTALCAICVKFPPFDGRKLFCGFGEVK